jgi:argininosuccinate lyase
MKGLPLSYNSDLQEDKEGFFDCVDTLLSSLEVFTGMISTITINTEKMQKAAGEGYILATDLADYLVKKGAAFRDAHGVVARLVAYAVKENKNLDELSIDEYREYSPLFEDDVTSISVESSLAARDNPGGTAPAQVEKVLTKAKELIGGSDDRG